MDHYSRDTINQAYNDKWITQPWKSDSSKYFHHQAFPLATLAPWFADAEFMDLYNKIKPFTLVDLYRCWELWTIGMQMDGVEGDVLEVGVWKGGTGAILARSVKDFEGKRVYLADTFSGVVKAGVHDDKYSGGEHSETSVALVTGLMSELSLNNVEVLEGIFPEDTGGKVRSTICMLHCDVDVYESSKDIVEWCLPRLSHGAVLVFDDYGFYGCEGVTRFCDEFKRRKEFRFINNLNGHAIFIKVA
ncbi:MAG: hypothetical protein HGB22_03225 [Chlorobiaceae bacterium]|nr:hypothetical protein [Chlorobiaceae bacterium]